MPFEIRQSDFITAGDSAVGNIYGQNLGRLQETKAQYDPNNVFHKMQPIERKK